MLYGVPFMFYDAHGPSLPLCGGVWRWYSRGDDVWRVGGWRAEVKGRGNCGVCTCQRAVSFPVFRMAIEVYRSAYGGRHSFYRRRNISVNLDSALTLRILYSILLIHSLIN
mgnify:CR=1 FL=1